MKKTFSKSLLGLGILMIFGSFYGIVQQERLLPASVPIEIEVPGDDTLAGTYFPGHTNRGLLLLEGFGSDQIALRPIAANFADLGYHILSFDFSGHGRSPGGLDFGNASTDRMAKQVLAADAALRELSGLPPEQITYLGHSLGARVGLQAATMTNTPPETLILLGTQVNLVTNQQAEFFTGTTDTDLEWVQALGPENPASEIILISGTRDDILTPEAALLLAEKLSGSALSTDRKLQVAQEKPVRVLYLPEGILHNYEIYSRKISNITPELDLVTGYQVRYPYWFLGLAGLFLALFAAVNLFEGQKVKALSAKVMKPGRFLGGKLLLWIPALIPGALIASAVFFAPVGTPAFNLYYIGFFGGYGMLLWFLYLKGRMPGVEGKLILKGNPDANQQQAYKGALAFILVLAVVSLLARSGWWYAFPFNQRFIWLLIFTPITALGFMIGFKEIEILRTSQPEKPWLIWLNSLVGLFPFFLYTAFLAALGSTSGVVGSIQGLVILALSITTGTLVQKISGRPWLAALLQAFLLYWLILPQGVLFR